MRLAWALLAAVAALALAGCSSLDPIRVAERGIRNYAAQRIGPAQSYTVHIQRSGTRLSRGYLSLVTLDGTRVQAASNLVFDRVHLELRDVVVDRESRTIVSIGDSFATGDLLEADANAYLAARNRGPRGLRLEFGDGTIGVVAQPSVGRIGIPVRMEGSLVPRDGREIVFVPDEMRVARLNVPRPLLRVIEDHINPVFRVDELSLPVLVDDVRVTPGKMTIEGRADVSRIRG
jgi:hypothetical protein